MSTRLRQEIPATIDDLATSLGISPAELRRTLRLLHAEHGGVLVKTANKWLVSMRGLRRAWPGFGATIPTDHELHDFREEVLSKIAALGERLTSARAEIARLKRQGQPSGKFG
jgi:predicted ArsR family transcriptional regulator